MSRRERQRRRRRNKGGPARPLFLAFGVIVARNLKGRLNENGQLIPASFLREALQFLKPVVLAFSIERKSSRQIQEHSPFTLARLLVFQSAFRD